MQEIILRFTYIYIVVCFFLSISIRFRSIHFTCCPGAQGPLGHDLVMFKVPPSSCRPQSWPPPGRRWPPGPRPGPPPSCRRGRWRCRCYGHPSRQWRLVGHRSSPSSVSSSLQYSRGWSRVCPYTHPGRRWTNKRRLPDHCQCWSSCSLQIWKELYYFVFMTINIILDGCMLFWLTCWHCFEIFEQALAAREEGGGGGVVEAGGDCAGRTHLGAAVGEDKVVINSSRCQPT